MATQAPQVTIAKSTGASRANGILPVPANNTAKRNLPQADAMSLKGTPSKLKVLIRRLPPGFTKSECETALGNDWKVNAGKVDWLSFKRGKLSEE